MERLNFDILDENHDITALEMLSTQIGGEWSASRAKENYEWGNTLTRVGQMGRPRGPGHMGRPNNMVYYGMQLSYMVWVGYGNR